RVASAVRAQYRAVVNSCRRFGTARAITASSSGKSTASGGSANDSAHATGGGRSWSTRRGTSQIVRLNPSPGDYAFAGSATAALRRVANATRAASAPTAPAAANAQAVPALSMTNPAKGAPAAVPAVSADPSRPVASPR